MGGKPEMDLAKLFPRCVAVDPLGPGIDSQLAAVPDKPAVYLLATEDDQPVLLASGLAVRSILKRRLGQPLTDEPETTDAAAKTPRLAAPKSKRADLRPLVRKLYVHPTASPFETDLWYMWLARALYPARYREMIPRRHCWMVHGDSARRIARLLVTDRFDPPGGRRVGPMAERQAATRLVDLLTGLFSLCHYYQVLRQAPHGRPCEYREMGRCSGPCEGTVSLGQYAGQVADALAFAADRGHAWRAEQTRAMVDAARALDFEGAGRIKARLAQAAELDHPRYQWLMDAERMDFLIVQPGASKAELRTFRGFAGRLAVGPMLARKSPADGLAAWLRLELPAADEQARADEAALLTTYLFHGEHGRGLFVPFAGQPVEELARVVAETFPPPKRSA